MGVEIDPGVLIGNPTGNYEDMNLNLTGSIKVKDFQWPALFGLGAAYKATDAFTLRGGFNRCTNPVPNQYLNALFPAIVENHISFGAGWAFKETMRIDVSLVSVFKKTATNPGNGSNIAPVESGQGQFNWAVMFSNHF